jgi:tRNA threonylcarbamoyladenosine biosynthesis protein TsaE
MTVRQWELPDSDATVRFGATLAAACPREAGGPRLAYLSGELGSGKTTLVAGLLHALGVAEPVRSPSYALLEVYPLSRGLAIHLDCYRLRGAGELEAVGLRDYFTNHSLVLIEWPEQVHGALPDPDLALHLRVEGAGRRCQVVTHTRVGERWLSAVEPLQNSPGN